jgi:hypothetical protein
MSRMGGLAEGAGFEPAVRPRVQRADSRRSGSGLLLSRSLFSAAATSLAFGAALTSGASLNRRNFVGAVTWAACLAASLDLQVMIQSSPNKIIADGTDWRFLTSSSAS